MLIGCFVHDLFVCLFRSFDCSFYRWVGRSVSWLVMFMFVFLHRHITFVISFFFFGKTTKNDRIYVNAPNIPKEKNENIQLLSFNSHNAEGSGTGEENKGLDTQEKEDEQDNNEEILTPGDLMAFAWQISQGMVSKS